MQLIGYVAVRTKENVYNILLRMRCKTVQLSVKLRMDKENLEETIVNDFEKILRMTQSELRNFLKGYLTDCGYNVIDEDGFLYAEGKERVLLVAHMDRHPNQEPRVVDIYKTDSTDVGTTVWKPLCPTHDDERHALDWFVYLMQERHGDINTAIQKSPSRRCAGLNNLSDVFSILQQKVDERNTIWMSPEGICGDDRAGIWIIMQLLKEGYCPSILFTEDEEQAGKDGHGSERFCRKKEYVCNLGVNYMVQIDKCNSAEAKFYGRNNTKFQKWITQKTSFMKVPDDGRRTDIAYIMPECNIAGVNLSCGYYCEHVWCEFIVIEEMLHTLDAVRKLLEKEADSVYTASLT